MQDIVQSLADFADYADDWVYFRINLVLNFGIFVQFCESAL